MINSKRAILLFICLGFIVFSNTFSNQFVWDDEFLVVRNAYIRDWRYLPQMFTSELKYTSPDLGNYYRPLQTLSYAIDYSFWRLNPFGYHLINLLLHIFCACLVYLVVKLFCRNSVALFTSLLFLVHPLSIPVVTYISGRADSLVALFFLVSFYLFVRSLPGERLKFNFYTLSVCCYLLALLSKETSLLFPLIFLLFLLLYPVRKSSISNGVYKQKTKAQPLIYCLPYFTLSLGYLMLRLTLLDFSRGTRVLFLWHQTPFPIRLFGFGKVILEYARLVSFPLNFHLSFGSVYPQSLFTIQMLLSVLILILIICFLVLSFRRAPDIFFFLCWFFLLLFPTANIIRALAASVAPHWLYLPAVGIFFIFSIFLVKLTETNKPGQKTLIGTLMVLILIFYAQVTFRYNPKWHDNITLYQHELKYAPDDCILHNNLGNEYRKNDLFTEAEKEYLQAVSLNSKYPLAYNNLGLVYLKQGLLDKAVNNFQKAKTLRPDLPLIYINLARALQKQGQAQLAEGNFQQALKINPRFVLAYYHLGVLYSELGNQDLAISAYQKAIEVEPLFVPAYYNLGFIFKQKGDLQQAGLYWQKAQSISPSNIFVQQALKELEKR